MSFLYFDNITSLFVWVDDRIPKRVGHRSVGRPVSLSESEMVTIFIWNILFLKHKTWKDLHQFLWLYHRQDFPSLPKYNGFLALCHHTTPVCLKLLQSLLVSGAALKFMDGTMLPVCKHKRADDHKGAKKIANFGKNWQGWHYGFKLHASITADGTLCALAFTQASVHEKNLVEKLLGTYTKVAVGDSSYGGKDLRTQMWKKHGTCILAPGFHGQKKLMTGWQRALLSHRSVIES